MAHLFPKITTALVWFGIALAGCAFLFSWPSPFVFLIVAIALYVAYWFECLQCATARYLKNIVSKASAQDCLQAMRDAQPKARRPSIRSKDSPPLSANVARELSD
jgi:hypothetical protein